MRSLVVMTVPVLILVAVAAASGGPSHTADMEIVSLGGNTYAIDVVNGLDGDTNGMVSWAIVGDATNPVAGGSFTALAPDFSLIAGDASVAPDGSDAAYSHVPGWDAGRWGWFEAWSDPWSSPPGIYADSFTCDAEVLKLYVYAWDGSSIDLVDTYTPPPIPEPGAFGLLGLGLVGLVRRKRKGQARMTADRNRLNMDGHR